MLRARAGQWTPDYSGGAGKTTRDKRQELLACVVCRRGADMFWNKQTSEAQRLQYHYRIARCEVGYRNAQ
jgi:hypothetical protein